MIHLIAALTLFAISGIHIYWALGGYWGISVAVPQQEGQPLFKPGMAVTIMVAMVLAYAGIVSLALAGISTPSL